MLLHLKSTNFGHLVYFQDQHLSGCCEEDVSLSRTLWPGNRVAICVAPAQKGPPPSIMDASSIYQTLRYFCHGQCIPIQCNAGDPNQKTLLRRFLELLDATAHCCTAFQVTKLLWCISPTSLMTQNAFLLKPNFSAREKEKGRQRQTHTQDGLVAR